MSETGKQCPTSANTLKTSKRKRIDMNTDAFKRILDDSKLLSVLRDNHETKEAASSLTLDVLDERVRAAVLAVACLYEGRLDVCD
jgi:hypothetical protein